MIARLWHGRTSAAHADAYLEFLQRTGLPDYRATLGNRGAWVLRRLDSGQAHFLTLSFWDSLDAIRAFAGPEADRARYYPEDPAYLLEMEPTVAHYEVTAG